MLSDGVETLQGTGGLCLGISSVIMQIDVTERALNWGCSTRFEQCQVVDLGGSQFYQRLLMAGEKKHARTFAEVFPDVHLHGTIEL